MPKKLSLALATILLLGAGCAAPASPTTPIQPTAPTGTPPVNAPVTNLPAGQAGAPPATPPGQQTRTLPAATGIDATWKTYTNAALGFSFQTPTKGRYAPTWEVSFVVENDERIEEGCYITQQNQGAEADHLRVNGVVFCRTIARDGAAGSVYITENVVTKKGTRYILMSFTKKAVNAGMLNCATQPESGLSVSSEACIPFVMAEFDAVVETIISTFAFTS